MIITRKSFLKEVSLQMRVIRCIRDSNYAFQRIDDESTPGFFRRPVSIRTFPRLSDDTRKLCVTTELVGTLVTIAIK